MAETAYEVELLNGNISKIFAGVYNDFKAKAVNEYKFVRLQYPRLLSLI